METHTNPNTAEVAHDTELYRLLAIAGQKDAALDEAINRALRNAASGYYAGHDYKVHVSDEHGRGRMVALADLPLGTIYWQSKTWTKGEGDRARIIVESAFGNGRTNRPARFDDLTEVPEAVETARAELAAARHAIAEHEVNYTGWSRYFLVVSSSGHVHSSMSCSTCNPRTGFAPFVSLSALTETEAVAELGETLCSVCFPSAPVDGRPSKLTAAAARKAAAKAVGQ